jgi:hypothetical protein
MLFYQAAAPTGWTQVTALNDYALRLVSGTGGTTGGTTAFSTIFSATGPTTGATTLSTAQIPSHDHSYGPFFSGGCGGNSPQTLGSGNTTNNYTTGATGGGGSHTHPGGNMNVFYANVIICSKN